MKLSYRPDIDGLRAFAVLSVIFYHFFPTFLPGGFVGVDIFFVISGYLITGIILNELKHNEFSLVNFYNRRIKRIFPALLLTLLTTLIFGWFTLYSDEFKQLLKHTAGATVFISNFILLNEVNYFDNEASTKPLLHLWSLGIEEQFYIFWPLLIWGIYRLKIRIYYIIIIITLCSISFNISILNNDISKAYFLPFTRFWELSSGALLASIHHLKIHDNLTKELKKYISIAGLIIIFLSVFFINEILFKRQYIQLIPILGTLMLIMANGSYLNKMILSNKLAVWLGLISFPLYLWHWPIYSFSRIIYGEPSTSIKFYGICLTLIFASITYWMLEQKIRHQSKKYVSKLLILLMLTLGAITFLLNFNFIGNLEKSFNKRLDSRFIETYNKEIKSKYKWSFPTLVKECGVSVEETVKKFQFCMHDSRDKVRFALIGDSKAGSLHWGLHETSHKNNRWLIIAGNNGFGSPAPFLNTKIRESAELINAAIDAVSKDQNIEIVTLVTGMREMAKIDENNKQNDKNWEWAVNANFKPGRIGLEGVINKLVESNKKIVLVTDIPSLENYKDCKGRLIKLPFIDAKPFGGNLETCTMTMNKYTSLRKNYMGVLKGFENKYPNKVKIFDTKELVFNPQLGLFARNIGEIPLFSYTDHMSSQMSVKIGKSLNNFLINWE